MVSIAGLHTSMKLLRMLNNPLLNAFVIGRSNCVKEKVSVNLKAKKQYCLSKVSSASDNFACKCSKEGIE